MWGQNFQRGLIKGLNAKLQGFKATIDTLDASDAFRHIDAVVSALLLKLTQELYPTKTKEQLIEKFWYTEADGTKIYALLAIKTWQICALLQKPEENY